jgi:hypothetical protein
MPGISFKQGTGNREQEAGEAGEDNNPITNHQSPFVRFLAEIITLAILVLY